MSIIPELTVAVVAKAGVLERVKTRLTRGPGAVSAQAALNIHNALFKATLQRVQRHVHATKGSRTRWVLAMDDPPQAPDFTRGWDLVDQGGGDLGERLDRVWRGRSDKQACGPIVFFGIDCPDVPAEALAGIGPALGRGQVAIGPVTDGGYWTLACAAYQAGLLQGIDWGTPAVYDQTVRAAKRLGLSPTALPAWHDVDEPKDLDALRQRLANLPEPREPALAELAARLDEILSPSGTPRP